MHRHAVTANPRSSEAWEPLGRYLKLIDVARDGYPFHQQIKFFVCFRSAQFELNEQSKKSDGNYANTLAGIFLLAPRVRGASLGI